MTSQKSHPVTQSERVRCEVLKNEVKRDSTMGNARAMPRTDACLSIQNDRNRETRAHIDENEAHSASIQQLNSSRYDDRTFNNNNIIKTHADSVNYVSDWASETDRYTNTVRDNKRVAFNDSSDKTRADINTNNVHIDTECSQSDTESEFNYSGSIRKHLIEWEMRNHEQRQLNARRMRQNYSNISAYSGGTDSDGTGTVDSAAGLPSKNPGMILPLENNQDSDHYCDEVAINDTSNEPLSEIPEGSDTAGTLDSGYPDSEGVDSEYYEPLSKKSGGAYTPETSSDEGCPNSDQDRSLSLNFKEEIRNIMKEQTYTSTLDGINEPSALKRNEGAGDRSVHKEPKQKIEQVTYQNNHVIDQDADNYTMGSRRALNIRHMPWDDPQVQPQMKNKQILGTSTGHTLNSTKIE
jgi:hypothetical protein